MEEHTITFYIERKKNDGKIDKKCNRIKKKKGDKIHEN